MLSNSMMFIIMFIIQYVFMSFIMTNRPENITNSLGKAYLSIMMGLSMIILMNLIMYNVNQTITYIVLLGFIIYLYKIQFGINDTNYLKEMIEHHSMALLTSKQILKKTDNSYVADIAQRIINTQEKEIHEMRNIIKLI
jgi:hypothetical protein